jgi:DNA-binding CsgD family transcriptional regulator/tetratricopeptide (TPR) repeat protein
VFAYADAAAHWQRAIELYEAEPGTDLGDGVDLPHLYIRAMDALDDSGDRVRAGAIAEAYRRFADLPDRTVAAVIHYRAAHFRAVHSPAEGLPLIREAFRLFEGTPPSDEHARAWVECAYNFLYQGEGRHTAAEIRTALHRGLEVAEAAGAASQIAQILALLAMESFLRGDLEDGFRLFDQARNQPGDAWAALEIAILESNVFLKVGRLQDATRVGQTGFDAARQAGLGGTADAAISLCNAVEGLLARGRVGEAAALIDPDTTGPVDWVHWPLLRLRADMDLVRGEVELAAQRLASIEIGGSEHALDVEQDIAEAALWADRSEEALEAVQRALERQADTVWVIYCGWLLAMGMRACADLAEQARALRDQPATQAALVAADDLASWVSRTDGAAFNEHPFVAIIPPARATWDTEHGRATGASDPAAWSVAAERWEALGYRHRAGYARWRQAEALLAAPHGGRTAATPVLSTAAGMAAEHVPLLTAIEDLARRARIDLNVPAEPAGSEEPAVERAFGLTERELDVLRLLGQGKTNPEIAAALFISPRTAGVHVTHILRKLDATTRVQAATIADRAGLLSAETQPPYAHH